MITEIMLTPQAEEVLARPVRIARMTPTTSRPPARVSISVGRAPGSPGELGTAAGGLCAATVEALAVAAGVVAALAVGRPAAGGVKLVVQGAVIDFAVHHVLITIGSLAAV